MQPLRITRAHSFDYKWVRSAYRRGKDGNVFFSKWQGKVSTTQSPEGKPIMKWEGTFSYVKGTGKWENIQGGGTYKGGFIARGIYVNHVEGEYFIKK